MREMMTIIRVKQQLASSTNFAGAKFQKAKQMKLSPTFSDLIEDDKRIGQVSSAKRDLRHNAR